MSIIAASLYRNGKRIGPVSLDQPVRCASDRSEFVWIGLFEPSEAELRQLQENYDLHPLAIEDALLAHQLPKLDIYGDQLFVVARPAHLADGQICYGETSVFVGETFIISVRHGSERAHSGLRQQLESSPGLLQHGVDYVLHAILDFIVDGYLPIVEAIEEEVLETEQRTLDAFLEREEIGRLFTLRRELIRFQRVLGPMHEVCVMTPCRCSSRRLAASSPRIGARQLAAWAAILAVPTAIAGIYGMNFANMPELKTASAQVHGRALTLGCKPEWSKLSMMQSHPY
jgi:magnesium transporter